MSVRRFPWTGYIVALAVIAVFAVSPVILAIVAGLIQTAGDCSNNVCMIAGSNWAPGLNTAQLAFWLVLVTWPIGTTIACVWLVVLLIHRHRHRKAGAA